MFPFCFEWAWDIGHLIFMGLLYGVLGAISLGLFYAFVMTWLKDYGTEGAISAFIDPIPDYSLVNTISI